MLLYNLCKSFLNFDRLWDVFEHNERYICAIDRMKADKRMREKFKKREAAVYFHDENFQRLNSAAVSRND